MMIHADSNLAHWFDLFNFWSSRNFWHVNSLLSSCLFLFFSLSMRMTSRISVFIYISIKMKIDSLSRWFIAILKRENQYRESELLSLFNIDLVHEFSHESHSDEIFANHLYITLWDSSQHDDLHDDWENKYRIHWMKIFVYSQTVVECGI